MSESGSVSKQGLGALRIDDHARGGKSSARTWAIGATIGVILIMVAIAVMMFGRTVKVEAATVRSGGSGRAAALLNASGYVTPRRRATIAAKITGRVTEIMVEEGMIVKEGQVLARLDDSESRARLVSAQTQRDAAQAAIADLEVNLANAERELKRQKDLEKDGISSVQALDLARTTAESLKARIALAKQQVKTAEAQIEVAQRDLDNCTVRAPFAGVAVSKDAQVGEMVSPISAGGGFTRTGISTIVDMMSLEIEVDVNEAYIARVQPGQKVEATLDAYPDWRIPGRVRTVIPTADRQKATVKVRISFDALDPKILPDMGVKVAFLGDQQPGMQVVVSTLIPREAARTIDGKSIALVIKGDRIERRAIKLGADRGTDVEVLAGLVEGESVVVKGPPVLEEGQKVRIGQ